MFTAPVTYDNHWTTPAQAHEFATWLVQADLAKRAKVRYDRGLGEWVVDAQRNIEAIEEDPAL